MAEYVDLPEGQGDEVETPPDLFRAILDRWHITWDAACTHQNRLIGVPADCLTAPWDKYTRDGVAFLNPPYSNPRPFLHAAMASGVPVVALLKADHSTRWWQEYVQDRGIVIPLASRVRFYYGGKPLRHVAAFPSVLVFYDAGLAQGTWR